MLLQSQIGFFKEISDDKNGTPDIRQYGMA